MMGLLTIMLFFVYTYGLGFTLTSFLKNSENVFERFFMRIGIGLAFFVVLGTILNFLHIPLDWRIFLGLSLIMPIIYVAKNHSKMFDGFKIRLTKSNLEILLVFIMFIGSMYMYYGGAMSYPYLEDDDPWEHAVGASYIAQEKTAFDSPNYNFQYFDPYPPGYDMLMGILLQTDDSVSWVLKFFNSLIISLGILFFFFFAKHFIGDGKKALFATFVLAALPSFFTHFIWAHTLVIILFFPAMYCLEMIKHDKKWAYVAIVAIASILLTQPTQAIKIGLMLMMYLAVKLLFDREHWKHIFIAEAGGLLLSLVWWYNKWGSMLSAGAKQTATEQVSLLEKIQKALPFDGGTATRPYTFEDFFYAQSSGGINVHVGWGIAISILALIGVIYIILNLKDMVKKENLWIPITLLWLIFTFLGTNSMTFNLPIGLFAFRFWLLLAIPVALISVLGLWFLFDISNKIKLPSVIILVLVVAGVLLTAGYQKYNQNHNLAWPPGYYWTSTEEVQGYSWLKTLPTSTKVFAYSTTDAFVIGFDKQSCEWCQPVVEFRKNILERNATELHSFLKSQGYEYMVISGMSYRLLSEKFGENKTKDVVNYLLTQLQPNMFAVAQQTNGMVAFRVL